MLRGQFFWETRMSESKLKSLALHAAGWGLLYGEFFDLYDAVDHLPADAGGNGWSGTSNRLSPFTMLCGDNGRDQELQARDR